MLVKFVVGSLLRSERFFSGYSGFPSPLKPTLPTSNLTSDQLEEEPLCGCATLQIIIYLFIYLFTADEVHQDERLGVLLILVEQVSCRT